MFVFNVFQIYNILLKYPIFQFDGEETNYLVYKKKISFIVQWTFKIVST